MINMIAVGDSLEVLKRLPDKCVQMCVTSPPYYRLRSYDMDDQIGWEDTPFDYLEKLVEVFREAKRVLKDDGVLFINIMDSYCAGATGRIGDSSMLGGSHKALVAGTRRPDKKPVGSIKQKDLMGIPHRLVFALQDDGWYYRQDIIWYKKSPMPSSCTDRFTTAHEYIFFLTKNSKYLFNQQREPCSEASVKDFKKRKTLDNKGKGKGTYEDARPDLCKSRENYMPSDFMRNMRNVIHIASEPYKGKHCAVYPRSLIRPLILAGSNSGDFVLDPFFGGGTTGLVCIEENRKFLGIELNPEYAQLAYDRILEKTGQKTAIKTFSAPNIA